MKFISIILCIYFLTLNNSYSNSSEIFTDPCFNTTGWKLNLCDYAAKNIAHSAWGFTHGKQNYLLAIKLAKEDKLNFDDDVLFSSSILHDIGALEKFADPNKPEIDHSKLASELVGDLLIKFGFPVEKIKQVENSVLAHMYSSKIAPNSNASVLLHNADTLNFLGEIGIARVLLALGEDFQTIEEARKFLYKVSDIKNVTLYGKANSFTKKLGQDSANATLFFLKNNSDEKILELSTFLKLLKHQGFGLIGN